MKNELNFPSDVEVTHSSAKHELPKGRKAAKVEFLKTKHQEEKVG